MAEWLKTPKSDRSQSTVSVDHWLIEHVAQRAGAFHCNGPLKASLLVSHVVFANTHAETLWLKCWSADPVSKKQLICMIFEGRLFTPLIRLSKMPLEAIAPNCFSVNRLGIGLPSLLCSLFLAWVRSLLNSQKML